MGKRRPLRIVLKKKIQTMNLGSREFEPSSSAHSPVILRVESAQMLDMDK